jgi:hypothetical protein
VKWPKSHNKLFVNFSFRLYIKSNFTVKNEVRAWPTNFLLIFLSGMGLSSRSAASHFPANMSSSGTGTPCAGNRQASTSNLKGKNVRDTLSKQVWKKWTIVFITISWSDLLCCYGWSSWNQKWYFLKTVLLETDS